MDKAATESYQGVLHFFSETGSEGGWYAFQDARFIKQLSEEEKRYSCQRCGALRDPQTNGVLAVSHSYSITQEMLDDPKGWEPPTECAPAQHLWQALSDESWSYEGMKMLANGDVLTVEDPNSGAAVWKGVIELEPLEHFTHDVGGMWVNQMPKNVPEDLWSRWFLDGYPARLERTAAPAGNQSF